MNNTISHIAIAVENIDKVKDFFQILTGKKLSNTHVVKKQKVNTGFIAIGDTNIEILEPYGEDTPISKFLKNKGGGLHHICIGTDSFDNLVEKIKNLGVRTLGEPSIGAKGKRVIFFHPKDTYNILVELEEN